jgi:hypothetical protein
MGESTELDKGLVEKITDPLTHLVRNSCDHGIEMPAERRAGQARDRHDHAGRVAPGRQHRDRGARRRQGPVRPKLTQEGARAGIDAPDDMSDADVWALIFAPGFSTAEVVTDVSGRGVGMDVVKKNITALGGTVEIESAEGFGMSVRVRLPLTLAIMDGMSVGVNNECYILPLASVVESFQVQADTVRTIGGSGQVVRVREEYLPVVELERVFDVPRNGILPDRPVMVVVEAEGRRAGGRCWWTSCWSGSSRWWSRTSRLVLVLPPRQRCVGAPPHHGQDGRRRAELILDVRREKDMLARTEGAKRYHGMWTERHAAVNKLIDSMLQGEEDEDNGVLRELRTNLDDYAKGAEPVFRQVLASGYDNATAARRMLEAKALFHAVDAETQVGRLSELITAEAAEVKSHSDAASTMARNALILSLAVALVLVVPLTLINMESICRPIGQAKRLAGAIADGDLAQKVDVAGRDEAADLMRALAAMQDKLHGLVGQVRTAADTIRTASVEVATGNIDLSQRTEQTASSLQQTASSMEQLTGTSATAPTAPTPPTSLPSRLPAWRAAAARW